MTAILPGATLGVMGGGQLGRMFVHAAQSMGYYVAVLDPDPLSPAGLAAQYHIQSGYVEEPGLAQLMQRTAAITIEFENVPANALVTLAAHRPVAPSPGAVAICQDRALEKNWFRRCGIACVPHAVIETAEQLDAIDVAALLPGILKTARLGYDSRGQVAVADREQLAAAWQQLDRQRCVLEQRVALEHELSVIVARSMAGQTVHLPVQRNLHRDGILAVVVAPAGLDAALEARALDAAHRIAEAMEYVGVLCVEFFALADGTLLANEMAPRPHNSGHYSIDACDVSQFELQVRTMTGAPLVQPRQHSSAVMVNLLGDLWFADAQTHEQRTPPWHDVLALPGVHLHLYGKLSARRGRKMGHVTVTAATPAEALATAREVAARLGLPPLQ